jgi:hypothetical protein
MHDAYGDHLHHRLNEFETSGQRLCCRAQSERSKELSSERPVTSYMKLSQLAT